MRRLRAMLVVLAAWVTCGTAWAGANCSLPEDLLGPWPPLETVRSRVASGQPLRIVAIGSSSTMGVGLSSPAAAWPARLETSLRRALPQLQLTVLNRAHPRQTAEQMTERLAADVLAEHPHLVIWEAGTAEAVRRLEVGVFRDTLLQGIEQIRAAGDADMILVNMQFSPQAAAIVDFEPYLEAMHEAAEMEAVPLFPRFQIMRYWVEEGMFDFEGTRRGDEMSIADAVHRCLGESLAAAVLRAAL